MVPVLLFAGCGGEEEALPPPFVGPADWVARAEAVRPDLEAELGASLGGVVELIDSTLAQSAAAERSETREIIENIEGERRGGELEEYLREATWGGATGAFGLADSAGRVRLNRGYLEFTPENMPLLLEAIFEHFIKNAYEGLGPALIDLVLIHELVHVHQRRSLGREEFVRSVKTRSDLLARRAVLEGHAYYIMARVAERRGLGDACAKLHSVALESDGPDLDELPYPIHDSAEAAEVCRFPYRQGPVFVSSAVARFGYPDAVRRMFESPPSLYQVSRPETWPEPAQEGLGTDLAAQRIRAWLAEEWDSADCNPVPLQTFDILLSRGTKSLRVPAVDAFREGQLFEARTFERGTVLGHLFAADTAAGARAIREAWVARHKALDAIVPGNPLLGSKRARYAEVPFEGGAAWLTRREYDGHDRITHEQQVLIRRGPYLLEVRLRDPFDAEDGALRLARRLLPLLPPDGAANPTSKDWRDRWRAVRDPAVATSVVLELLGGSDRDVRLAALLALGRRDAVDADVLALLNRDPDWEVRYQVRRLSAKLREISNEERIENLRTALMDPHPALPAAECSDVRKDCYGEPVPVDLIEKLLSHAAARVRREAARFLEQNVEREISPVDLAAVTGLALKDPDPDVRCQAAGSLYYHDDRWDSSLRATAFRQALSDEDVRVRHEALSALNCGNLVIPECLPELECLLKDESDTIREDAQEAIDRIRK